jgi:Fe-S oxidoreductase/nitrate reductase gamma subunit
LAAPAAAPTQPAGRSAVPETRTVFDGLSRAELVIWYGLIVAATAVFTWGAARLVAKYRSGTTGKAMATSDLFSRLAAMSGVVFSHKAIVRRDRLAGYGHLLIYYAFLTLFLGTTILGIDIDFTRPVFHWNFWQGGFYLVYKLALDIAGVMLLAGLVLMAVNRAVRRPARLDYRRPDRPGGDDDRRLYRIGDWVFVGTLGFLAVSGFLLEGFWLAQSRQRFADWSPVGWVLMKLFEAMGLTGSSAELAHHITWWCHGLVALVFVASIPFTKAVHMLAGPANVAVRDPQAGKRLVELAGDAAPEDVGYSRVTDLSWQHLVSLDACTKCGKCTDACPAAAAGHPLSPRDLILDLREAAESSLGAHAALRSGTALRPPPHGGRLVLGDPIRPASVWACTQCMACVEICPVGIEHVPIINQFRRQLVEQGEMDPLLQATFETVHKAGNSFGEPKRKRAKWTDGLGFEVNDARKVPAELLWFVGDYASFDPRSQKVSRSLARILRHAGIGYGILYDAERTAGCDVRRAGEEGLYTTLAELNVATISACDFERIVSSDPHSYHTLKNEYPAFGGDWTVIHHSELILELIESGRLVPARPLGCRVTYHDPCMLGRYNGVYEAPRRVLEAIGAEIVEMPRNRDNALCCGAGGGRIWMKEDRPEGSRRTSEQRIDEATALGQLDYFVVACPKDVTMYADAIKTSGHEGEIELRELTELVLESLDLGDGAGTDAAGLTPA